MTIYRHDISLSDAVYARLKRQADATHLPVPDVIGQAIERGLPYSVEEELPPLLKAELEAMGQLSDEALWAIASSQLTPSQREEFERLNHEGQRRSLTDEEAQRQDQLLAAYDATLLRRSHAAILLKERGISISDPTQFNN